MSKVIASLIFSSQSLRSFFTTCMNIAALLFTLIDRFFISWDYFIFFTSIEKAMIPLILYRVNVLIARRWSIHLSLSGYTPALRFS